MKVIKICLSVALFSAFVPEVNAAPKDDVLAAVNMRYEAMVSQDMDAYALRLADDINFYSPLGTSPDKKALIKQMGPGGTDQMLAYELVDPVIHVYGNTATVYGIAKIKSMSRGKELNVKVRYLDVWVNRDGLWQLKARQAAAAK